MSSSVLCYAKAKYAFTGMDAGDLRFDKNEVFLVTKKEGAWWWGMREPEEVQGGGGQNDEPQTGSEGSNDGGRRVRIVMSNSADQGRFPKNYVTEISKEEYLMLKKEQDAMRQRRKDEEARRKQEQEKVWSEKLEQIRLEEETRQRVDRSKLKLQKVFGSEGDITLLSPRSQRENQLKALCSPRGQRSDEDDDEPPVANRQWHRKKKTLPASLERIADEYQERKKQIDQRMESSSSVPSPQESAPAGGEEGDVESDQSAAADRSGVLSRRRAPTPSTMFMEDMSYLAPELTLRAEEARRKRVRGRNAVSLDRH